MKWDDVTMTQKNLGQAHANMHVRKIARERGMEFECLLAQIVNSKLWRKLADAYIYKQDPEPVLKQIRDYEVV